MIRGYFSPVAEGHRPVIDLRVGFPLAGDGMLNVQFLIDTGANRTVLGSAEASQLESELGVDLAGLPQGPDIGGVGGSLFTQEVDAELVLGDERIPLNILVAPPYPTPVIPSLLGRDVLAGFALFLEERTERVFLLTHDEAAGLPLL
jgi:hypothetical protein